MVMVPNWLLMPPPYVALLPERVELVRVRAPLLLNIAPPKVPAEFPESVEFETLRVPELLKAPPLPEVFAPETVTPEIERLPPEAMLKILKSRLPLPPSKPLMVREVAPGPVMASVPAVVAVTMEGKDEPSVIVPAPPVKSEEANSIVSASAEALAVVIASRSVVKASAVVLSASELTIMVAGVILSSRKVSWGGRRKGLSFLFEVVNRLKRFIKKLPIFKIPIKDYQTSKTWA